MCWWELGNIADVVVFNIVHLVLGNVADVEMLFFFFPSVHCIVRLEDLILIEFILLLHFVIVVCIVYVVDIVDIVHL